MSNVLLISNGFCSVSSDISITRKKKRDKRLTTGGLDDVIEESVGSVSAREEMGGGENAFGGEVCEVSERSPLCVLSPFSLSVLLLSVLFLPAVSQPRRLLLRQLRRPRPQPQPPFLLDPHRPLPPIPRDNLHSIDRHLQANRRLLRRPQAVPKNKRHQL